MKETGAGSFNFQKGYLLGIKSAASQYFNQQVFYN
jgi:hypothetical protein